MTESHPPFFIVGSARSGTTLLRLMLNAHSRVAVPPESRFITELWTGEHEIDTEDFLRRLEHHRQFRAWELPIDEVRAHLGGAARAPYSDAVSAPYVAYARRRDRVVWGDKTPRYVEHIEFLSSLFPGARFVHLVRDGRNVALSYADVPFGPKTVSRAAALWAQRVEAGRRSGATLDAARYLEMRYETFLDDPRTGAEELCNFLGLEFDPGMLDYTERAKDAVLDRAQRYNPHVLEQPVKKTRSWQTDLPPAHVETFEAVAGDTLSVLGYERRHPVPSQAARLRARLGLMGVPVGRLRGRRW